MKNYIEEQLRTALLSEALTDVVYHFTNINRLENILTTDEIYLTPVFGTKSDHDINAGKLYALSLSSSRSLDVGYGVRAGVDQVVRLTFNGRTLNHNLKSKRVDYWQRPKDPNHPTYKSTHKDELLRTMSGSDELEDRVLSDHNSIGPAHKLISVIEIFSKELKGLSKVKLLADKLGIDLYVYNERKYFNGSVKSKAVTIPTGEPEQDESREGSTLLFSMGKTLTMLFYKNSDLQSEMIRKFEDMGLSQEKVEGLMKDETEKFERIVAYRMDDYFLRDFLNSWQADVHNMKSDPDPFFRYTILKLAQDMKKNNCKTMRDYMIFKGYIGKKTDIQFKQMLIDETFKVMDEAVNNELEYKSSVSFNHVDTGDWDEGLFQRPKIQSFIINSITKLKNYIKTNVLKREDFQHLLFDLDNTDLFNHLGVSRDYDDPFWKSIDPEIEYDTYEVSRVIELAIYSATDTLRSRYHQMEKERNEQWRK